MKSILMCPPDFYDIEYEINPWMDLSNKVDKELVQEQYFQLKSKFEELGTTVMEIPAQRGLPDMVYSANYGHIEGEIFIPANFKFEQRRKESSFAKEYFDMQGYEIKEIPNEIFFEGQGDLLKAGNNYFMGYGKRSMKEAAKYVSEFIGYDVKPLEVIDPYYYHLDMCLGPISEDIVVINPKSFNQEGLETIRDSFGTVIEASEEDNKVMACNLVVVGENILLGEGITDDLRESIEDNSFELHELNMSEYVKGGGSVKCCSLEVWD